MQIEQLKYTMEGENQYQRVNSNKLKQTELRTEESEDSTIIASKSPCHEE